MGINAKCPKCGSTRVQLTNESSKHGCLYSVLFGVYYFLWLMVRYYIGFLVLIFYDWWMAIVHAAANKGHKWLSKRWFSNRRRIFYCHNCGYNFRT